MKSAYPNISLLPIEQFIAYEGRDMSQVSKPDSLSLISLIQEQIYISPSLNNKNNLQMNKTTKQEENNEHLKQTNILPSILNKEIKKKQPNQIKIIPKQNIMQNGVKQHSNQFGVKQNEILKLLEDYKKQELMKEMIDIRSLEKISNSQYINTEKNMIIYTNSKSSMVECYIQKGEINYAIDVNL